MTFISQLASVLSIGVVMLLAFVVMRAAYGVHVQLHGYSYSAALHAGNSAAAVRMAGILFGSSLAFWGILRPTELGVLADLSRITQCLVQVIVYMVIAGYINDKLILHRIDNLHAIFQENNVSVALIEFGSFTSTGLIFWASQGADSSWVHNLLWFAGGQVLMIAAAYAFAFVHDPGRGIDEMQMSAGHDDRSYALSLTGFLVSIGMVLHVVIGNAERPAAVIMSLLVWLIVTVLLQLSLNTLLVRGGNLKQMVGVSRENSNVGAGVLQGMTFLMSALAIAVL